MPTVAIGRTFIKNIVLIPFGTLTDRGPSPGPAPRCEDGVTCRSEFLARQAPIAE
jgi:hypothetical protein